MELRIEVPKTIEHLKLPETTKQSRDSYYEFANFSGDGPITEGLYGVILLHSYIQFTGVWYNVDIQKKGVVIIRRHVNNTNPDH